MWVSHLCGSGRCVSFVPGGVGAQRACFARHINGLCDCMWFPLIPQGEDDITGCAVAQALC